MRHLSGDVFSPGSGSHPLSRNGSGSEGPAEMLMVAAARFEDAEAVLTAVRGGRTVVLNIAGLPQAVGQRLVDFVSGGITAMDGQVHRLGEEVLLLAPALALVEEDSPATDAGELNQGCGRST